MIVLSIICNPQSTGRDNVMRSAHLVNLIWDVAQHDLANIMSFSTEDGFCGDHSLWCGHQDRDGYDQCQHGCG